MERDGDPLFWFDGLLVLPVGARIQLDNVGIDLPQFPLDPERFPRGRVDGVVVGVQLRNTQSDSRFLMLEVELTDPEDPAWTLQMGD